MNCPLCGAMIDLPPPIGRRDECPACGADLHACRCCTFFEPGAHNDCREPQADRVVEKDAANFCDYFRLTGEPRAGTSAGSAKAKAAFDELFKK